MNSNNHLAEITGKAALVLYQSLNGGKYSLRARPQELQVLLDFVGSGNISKNPVFPEFLKETMNNCRVYDQGVYDQLLGLVGMVSADKFADGYAANIIGARLEKPPSLESLAKPIAQETEGGAGQYAEVEAYINKVDKEIAGMFGGYTSLAQVLDQDLEWKLLDEVIAKMQGQEGYIDGVKVPEDINPIKEKVKEAGKYVNEKLGGVDDTTASKINQKVAEWMLVFKTEEIKTEKIEIN